jgi:hypothetical protein
MILIVECEIPKSSIPSCVFVLVVLGFELRALNLLGRCSTFWAIMPPHLFLLWCLKFFSGASLGLWPFHICFLPCNWDHSTEPPCLTSLLRWNLTNFLPRSAFNCDSPNLYLLNVWDYRHKLPCPAPIQSIFDKGIGASFSKFVHQLEVKKISTCPWVLKCHYSDNIQKD